MSDTLYLLIFLKHIGTCVFMALIGRLCAPRVLQDALLLATSKMLLNSSSHHLFLWCGVSGLARIRSPNW